MIVAFGSRKASPGVTTLTALVAAYWEETNTTRVVIEADASGGTLAARWNAAHSLSWDPGLLALCASRGSRTAESIQQVSQPIGDDLFVAAAPPAPHQIAPALAGLGDRGAADLASADGLRAFVDCGRLDAESPSLVLAKRAALTVLVCRPTLEEVHTLLAGARELQDSGCVLGLVCVGTGPYHPAEIAEHAEIDLIGAVPHDLRGATAFTNDGMAAGRTLARSPLGRVMAELGGHIRQKCADVTIGTHHTTSSQPDDPSTEHETRSRGAEPVGFAELVEGDGKRTAVLNGVSHG